MKRLVLLAAIAGLLLAGCDKSAHDVSLASTSSAETMVTTSSTLPTVTTTTMPPTTTTTTRTPLVVVLTNDADLRYYLSQAATELMGRGVVEEPEVAYFIRWYHDAESAEQTAAYNGESYTKAPTADAAAREFIQARFPTEVQGYAFAKAAKVVDDMIRGTSTSGQTCRDIGHEIRTTDRSLDLDGDGIGCEAYETGYGWRTNW